MGGTARTGIEIGDIVSRITREMEEVIGLIQRPIQPALLHASDAPSGSPTDAARPADARDDSLGPAGEAVRSA